MFNPVKSYANAIQEWYKESAEINRPAANLVLVTFMIPILPICAPFGIAMTAVRHCAKKYKP